MGKASGVVKLDKIELEKVQAFYRWLQGGEPPERMSFKKQPHLTADEAFSVIYYLQEELEILPDNIEKCRECGELFDSCNEGTSISEDTTIIDGDGNEIAGNFQEEEYGLYCEDCRPD